MTSAERAALRALADAATPGPWELIGFNESTISYGVASTAARARTADSEDEENAAFIAECRSAVPALLDALDAAEADFAAAIAWLREQAQKVREHGGTDVAVAMLGNAAACIEEGRHRK